MFLTFLSVVLYASLPVMKMKFLMPIAAEAFNFYMLSLIWDLIFFIGSFFYLIGRAIAALKEKSMKLRYKGENLFYFGQVLSRLKSTTATLTLISITFDGVCNFVFAGSVSGGLGRRIFTHAFCL